MEAVTWINLVISSLVLFSITYVFVKLIKWNNEFAQKITKLLSDTSVTVKENGLPTPAFYGPKAGEQLPPFEVLNMNSEDPEPFQINQTKDTCILITLLGCESCKQTLKKMKFYNLKAYDFETVIMTYVYPGVYKAEEKIAEHQKMLDDVSAERKYIVLEPAIKQLEISLFPTLIRVDKEGKVLGTYSADAHLIDPIFSMKEVQQAS